MRTEEEVREYREGINREFGELCSVVNTDKKYIMEQLLDMYRDPMGVIGKGQVEVFQALVKLLITTMASSTDLVGRLTAVDWVLAEKDEKNKNN